jgi:hypothetical protein
MESRWNSIRAARADGRNTSGSSRDAFELVSADNAKAHEEYLMFSGRRKILGLLLLVLLGGIYAMGRGLFIASPRAESPQARPVDPRIVHQREARMEDALSRIGVAANKQILFGDLHVHTTFSFDAFLASLPMAGGEGAHPVADACDYARHCSALDFWSINDHAITLGPRRWAETVDSIRQCNDLSTDDANPDTIAYLGWEWTQVGPTPESHWGHKNVVLRDLADDAIPTRPISAGLPPGAPNVEEVTPSTLLMGLYALWDLEGGSAEFIEYTVETAGIRECPTGLPVREMPTDCRESAPTPELLFDKLDDWNLEALVIPHGTAWGFYTPPGSSWDKQLSPSQHDSKWQRIIEVYSGHGNSEEFRPFREVIFADDGTRSCPEPTRDYLPSCWRAGEIIEERCISEGLDAEECGQRAAQARQHFIDTDRNGGSRSIPGSEIADWQDAGQCRDCFLPAFNLRPHSSVQYVLALGREEAQGDADQFRFGMIASSDNHSARPGTGYKEVSRREFTEARFANFTKTPLGEVPDQDPIAESNAVDTSFDPGVFSIFETERGASFFQTGGLAAVHSEGRSREEVWRALQRREVYGTSGPRILLFFDLLNAERGQTLPMGSVTRLDRSPIFQVRAVGSFEQKPGCPEDARGALGPDRLARLCQGECYHPGEERRPISRIEVVRIQPQKNAEEAIADRIEDPWQVFPCPGDPAGCQIAFTDPEFATSGRDSLYYVRAIESPSPVIGADPLGCNENRGERCTGIQACSDRSSDDDCLSEAEERAWSSPIFISHSGG